MIEHYIVDYFSGTITWLDILIRVVVAVLVGIFIGIERELANHPAGMKTHALVCVGSAVTTMITLEMSHQLAEHSITAGTIDISRIAAGVISGIGFIGAGAIIKSRDGSVVTGITTAATVWVAGCTGLAIGMGYFKMVFISVAVILLTTFVLKRLEERFIKSRGMRAIEIILTDKSETLPVLEDYFDRKQLTVTSFDCVLEDPDADGDDVSAATRFVCRYHLRVPKGTLFTIVMRDIARLDNVIEVYETGAAASKKTVKENQT